VIREVEDLLGFFGNLELGDIAGMGDQLSNASIDLEQGRLVESKSGAFDARSATYGAIQDVVWQLVDEANANPRNSKIPLRLLSVFANARNMIEGNDIAKGESYLYSALKDWSASIPEPMLPVLSILLVIDLLRKRRRR
jgi:hypothetical protein